MKIITIIALPDRNKDLLADPTRNTGVNAKIEIIKMLRECSEKVYGHALSLKRTKDIIDSVPCSFVLDETRMRMMGNLLEGLGCKWDVRDTSAMAIGQDGSPLDVTPFDIDREIMKDEIAHLRGRLNDMSQEMWQMNQMLMRSIGNHDAHIQAHAMYKDNDGPSMHGMGDDGSNGE
jgi:hypothetical protein